MIDLINRIFEFYNYIGTIDFDKLNLKFYKHNDIKISNYFMVYMFDCRKFETDKEKVICALDQLENEYKKGKNSLKQEIIDTLDDKEASQVDKNTSAIYLMLFENIENAKNYRSELYSIEESPYYFKRYVLPYTQNQIGKLNKVLIQNPDKTIVNVLSDIVDNEHDYFDLLNGNNLDSTYGLVVRMFSKIPFLQYDFKVELAPESLDKQIENELKPKLLNYHNILDVDNFELDDILQFEEDCTISEEKIEIEINKLINEV